MSGKVCAPRAERQPGDGAKLRDFRRLARPNFERRDP